jgi:hypothetical protein
LQKNKGYNKFIKNLVIILVKWYNLRGLKVSIKEKKIMEQNSTKIDVEELLKNIRAQGLTTKLTQTDNPEIGYFVLPESGLYVYLKQDFTSIKITHKKLSLEEIQDVGHYGFGECPMIEAKFKPDGNISEIGCGIKFTKNIEEGYDVEAYLIALIGCDRDKMIVSQSLDEIIKDRKSNILRRMREYSFKENKDLIQSICPLIDFNIRENWMMTEIRQRMSEELIRRLKEFQSLLAKQALAQKEAGINLEGEMKPTSTELSVERIVEALESRPHLKEILEPDMHEQK